MRLIDADELKKAYFNAIEKSSIGEVSIIGIIDNAPTVIWCSETSDGLPLMDLRPIPQGEWIYLDKDDVMKVECPFCHNRQCCISNYCDYCGADMKPKPNQLRDCENCIHHSENGCEVWECEFKRRSS